MKRTGRTPKQLPHLGAHGGSGGGGGGGQYGAVTGSSGEGEGPLGIIGHDQVMTKNPQSSFKINFKG